MDDQKEEVKFLIVSECSCCDNPRPLEYECHHCMRQICRSCAHKRGDKVSCNDCVIQVFPEFQLIGEVVNVVLPPYYQPSILS